jgi:uncharacterized protein YutD
MKNKQEKYRAKYSQCTYLKEFVSWGCKGFLLFKYKKMYKPVNMCRFEDTIDKRKHSNPKNTWKATKKNES